MDLSSYARRAAAFSTAPLADADLKKLGRLLDRGATLADCFTSYRAELGGHSLSDFCRSQQVYREYISWRDTLQATVTERRDAEQQLIPNNAIEQTWTPNCVRWLSTVATTFSPDDYPTHSAWHTVMVCAARLWADGFSLSLREARIALPENEEEGADNGDKSPLDIPTYQWLAMRAGSKDVEITLPEESLRALSAEVCADLGDTERDGLRTRMFEELPDAVMAALDRRSVVNHITAICAMAIEPEASDEQGGAAELSASDTERLSEVLASVQHIQSPAPKPEPVTAGGRRKREGDGRKTRPGRPTRGGQRGGAGRGGRRPKTNYNPGLQSIRDLASGLELKGRVRNTNRFGTFVDVGIDKEGLIPVRVLQNSSKDGSRIKLANGTMVSVRVRNVDAGRNRFDLEYLGQAQADEK